MSAPSRRKRAFKWRRFGPVQILTYAGIRTLIAATALLTEGGMLRLGRGIGAVLHFVDRGRRRIAEHNLLQASGMPRDPVEVRKLIRSVYRHLGLCITETLLLARWQRKGVVDRHVRMEGREHIDAALRAKRGVVIASAHLGNWEFAGQAMSILGYDLRSIARPIENPRLDAYVNALRRSYGQKIIFKHDAVRAMIEAVRDNALLGIICDQNARKNSVYAEFFGRPAATVRSPALMAVKYGAALVPLHTWREPDGRHVVEATAPIEPPAGLEREAAIEAVTQELARRIEEFVRRHPDQWMWIHERWKSRPDGTKDRVGAGAGATA